MSSLPPRQIRTLLVSANISARRILRSFLVKDATAVYDVVEEAHVKAASRLYLEGAFDLVLLVDTVEHGTPLDFLQGISLSPDQWHPVIFVHLSESQELSLDALRLGAKEFLELTTLTSHELARTIARVLETLDLHRENIRMQLENQRMLAELTRSNSELAQFASVISHDLKEPLRKITSFGAMLKEQLGALEDPDALRYLDRMVDGAYRMGGLMQALLDVSRVSNTPKSEDWNSMQGALAQALDSLEIRLQESGGTIDVVNALPMVKCNSALLHQLFQNLVGNALKYAREGVVPCIKIHAEHEGSTGAHLRIEDNGIGFSIEHAEVIFKIFQRLHARNSPYEGHGVGLSICKRIVESMGGTIVAEGKPGEGAIFHIHLPVVNWGH